MTTASSNGRKEKERETMIALIQRVQRASVSIDNAVVGNRTDC